MNELESPEIIQPEYEQHEVEHDLTDAWSPAICMAEMGQRPLPSVDAYVDKFAYAGAVTLLAGAPKAGKSTFLYHLVNAVSSGSKFLDKPTNQANVLYATEQSEASFRAQTVRVPKFFDNNKTFVLLVERNCTWRPKLGANNLPDTDPVTGKQVFEIEYLDKWEKQVEFWRKMIVKTHAKILVVDTFTSFARLKENANNDPGIVATRLMELKSLFQTRPELSIIVLHHLRKLDNNPKSRKWQDEGDVLGSQSYIAGVDQIVVLSEDQSEALSPTRRLLLKGRFDPEETMRVALLRDQYVRVGI